MANPVVHFDIPAEDPDKLSEFYRKIFDWKVEKTPVGGGYWLLYTKDGEVGIDGGIYKRTMPEQQTVNYITVDSVDEYSRKAGEAGGQVVVEKTEIPDMGSFAICLDPEGNPFGIWEEAEKKED